MTEEEKIICKQFLNDADKTHSCNEYKMLMALLEQEQTAKNDLVVDCIDRAELLKAMDTWDKFGYTETGCFVRAPENDYVPYVRYGDMVKCVKRMPSVTPQDIDYKAQYERLSQKAEIVISQLRADRDRLMSLTSVTPIRPKGHWIDHSDEGYVECPKCGSATNCDDNINDLHFCFSCGAEMGVEE